MEQRSRTRQIVHLDMDAFYASVEQRDRPELRGRAVIVGGSAGRGVVSACSYEARRFGVHSAMPMAQAVRLCPDARVLPVRMGRYKEVSRQIFAIIGSYSDRIEPLSIDEAFVDLTGCERLLGPAVEVARRIRSEVRGRTGLAVSAGVAPNKFLAKLASEAAKPDGLLEVPPEGIDAFLLPLPLRRLWGIGAVTAAKLEKMGIGTVAELRGLDRQRLIRSFGSAGDHLYRMARGIDEREVRGGAPMKSVGNEETFDTDLRGEAALRRELWALAERVARRLRRGEVRGRTLTVKVRYGDFTTVTRSETLAEAIDHGLEIFGRATVLLGRTEALTRPVRLLGVTLSQLEPAGGGQAGLFEDGGRIKRESLDRAVDLLADRFGGSAPRRGALLEREEE